jgi:hypothetical protein
LSLFQPLEKIPMKKAANRVVMQVVLPPDLASACTAAAELDLISASAVCRIALARDLERRGLFRAAPRTDLAV